MIQSTQLVPGSGSDTDTDIENETFASDLNNVSDSNTDTEDETTKVQQTFSFLFSNCYYVILLANRTIIWTKCYGQRN